MTTEIHVKTIDRDTAFFFDATLTRCDDHYIVKTGERSVIFPIVNVIWLVQKPPSITAPDITTGPR